MVKIKNDDELRNYLQDGLKKIASFKCKDYSPDTIRWLKKVFVGYDLFVDSRVINLAFETLRTALAYYKADNLFRQDDAYNNVRKFIDTIKDFKNREMISILHYIVADVQVCATSYNDGCCPYGLTVALAQTKLKNLELE